MNKDEKLKKKPLKTNTKSKLTRFSPKSSPRDSPKSGQLKTLTLKTKTNKKKEFVYRASPDVKKILRSFRKNIKMQFIKWFGGNSNKDYTDKGSHTFHYWTEN